MQTALQEVGSQTSLATEEGRIGRCPTLFASPPHCAFSLVMERDYRREYEERNRRAHERGFASYWKQRLAPRLPRRPADFGRLPEEARESRSAALGVVSRARDTGSSLEEAARELRVPMSVVRWWAPDAVGPTRHGRTFPTPADRLLRLRPVVVRGKGLVFLPVRGSRQADLARAVWDVQWRFMHGEASVDELARVRDVRIAGEVVETDPDELERLGDSRRFDPDDPYREIIGD